MNNSVSDVGIYILSYPGDYYLSTALVRSLKYFAPETPIMIIPGEGVDRNDHPFDVPLMRKPGGFWGRLGHADRKFWSFQGPFEKFIYLDGDVICTRPITPLIDQIINKDGKYIIAEFSIDDGTWSSAVADDEHKLHGHCINRVNKQLGNVELLSKFDPRFDPFAHYTFNNGVFASNRSTINEKDFEDLYNREIVFFRDILSKEHDWKSFDLFFGDQGRLNYLVGLLDIERSTSKYGRLQQWGGEPKEILLDKVLSYEAESYFIHWAGCPRPSPSLYCKQPLLSLFMLGYPGLPSEYKSLKEIPAYSVWWYFTAGEQQRWNKLSERLKWTWRDTRRIINKLLKIVKKKVKTLVTFNRHGL